ncbi:MAG: FmdB family transcriptional regulator [Deltaproteobacteria bacterium CG_4_10_14_3_um_filter_51_14]|nr:zinc ribbon domain-containing protein [bacterium]NCP07729.1 zinc ribbon domain-containing protein [bacterium]PIY21582.1 MAG: FmdB family transcriptional regulator [Deltaproteobacteria bacterium CG_4_10_14_3_um_filter_51_14]
MPIYEFECKDCGRQMEILLLPSETNLASCPECGGRNLKRLLSVPAPAAQTQGMPSKQSERCCGSSGPPTACAGPGSCCGKA